MSDNFRYTSYLQEIRFGIDAFDQLSEIVAQQGWARVLLVTTRSQRANGRVTRVEQALGAKLVAVFDATEPHVPQANVDDATQLARGHDADALLALGGGSAIGVAKGTSYTFPSPLPLAAIPTTYAGSEMTPVFGVTRVRDGVTRKETTTDPRILPRIVVYDPRLTLDLPQALTASTGVNALAHCVEAVYSITRNPLSSAAALYGARLIYTSLPRCFADGNNLAARSEVLQGAYLAGAALSNVAMGLHHGVCHVLGGTLNIPHGVANAIVLPHAIRFNAAACAPELAQLARALGLESEGEELAARELARRVAQWMRRMELPFRLRDAGVPETDLPRLADLAVKNKTVQNNPVRVESAQQMEQFLREMW